LDRNSGKLLSDVEVLTEESPDPVHHLNSFASPSPVIEDGRLYCHFGTNGTACLDTKSGEVVWTNRELKLKHENGPGSTPILFQEWLIVHCDGSDTQSIAALNKSDGKLAWKTARSGKMDENPQLKKAYGTPLVTTVAGRELVLSPAANWLYAYEPATGREVWKVEYGTLGFSIVPRPVIGHGMLYFSTTFMKPEILAIKLDEQPTIAWRFAKQAPNMPSPLLIGDELYLIADKGVATCLDAKTGAVVWTERLGGNFCSSPIFADGRIYVGNREGQTFVFAPGREFKLLATNQLDGQIMATPAAVDSALFVRTDKAMYRIGQ
jgi:outer membrane protein assembly factor BamB